ncbi:alpha/beta fold hydrolase [Nakamurella lactea]|uniref:alpha/beta fold hydrolase n=1 Tax=Nakamurella lactea TaxID=459515 RepID=UPI0003FA1F61|nr:alpha/beta fold hydrolase [Nakamurella lactea]
MPVSSPDGPTPAELDAALGEVDWGSVPDGAVVDTVSAPSGRLARITLGPEAGRRVLLVPGATGSKEDFVVMMPLLARQGYRVESYDLAGQFDSAAAGPQNLTPPADGYRMSLFTDDLTAVLTDRPTPAHVLGYSFAGTVAAAVAVDHPDLVASLTLLSAPPLSGQAFRGLKIVGPLTNLASRRAAAAVMIWGIRLNLNRVGRSRLTFVRNRLRHTDRRSVDDIIGLMMQTPDLRAGLRAAQLPTLVAIGTGDLWPTARHREFADAIGARLAAYPTGHSPCETTPHQLVADMVELFKQTDST